MLLLTHPISTEKAIYFWFRALCTLPCILMLCCCSVLPNPLENTSSSEPSNHSKQELLLSIRADIAELKWHQAQKKLYSTQAKARPNDALIKRQLKQHKKQQQQLAKALIDACLQLKAKSDFFLMSECYKALSKVPLDEADQQRYAPLKQAMHDFKSETQKVIEQNENPTPTPNTDRLDTFERNKLIDSLAVSIKQGDLLSAHTFLKTLTNMKENTPQQVQRIDQLRLLFDNKFQALDHYADQLYQQKSIIEARAIWQMLLKINPNDLVIQNKHHRADKVLKNLQELRQDGYLLSP